VEGFWTLPNGDEHGWQAKFFLSSPDAAQWQQIDKSVRNALDKHPRLTRYTVCLPVDRSDARIEQQTSFLQKWDEHVQDWKGLRKSGTPVEFEYWGAHEFWQQLSGAENRGRYRFWFDHDLLTPDWLRSRLAEMVKNVGPRYTRALNVDLPISRLFDGLSRTSSFYQWIGERISDVRRRSQFLRFATAPKDALQEFTTKYKNFLATTSVLSDVGSQTIDWPTLRTAVTECVDAATAAIRSLRKTAEEQSKKAKSTQEEDSDAGARSLPRQSRDYEYELNRYCRAAGEFLQTLESEEITLTNLPALLIVGEAGTGKTHLL